MEQSVTASEANRSFSKLLRDVEHGHRVAVTRHGRVVARIIPSDDAEEANRRRRAAAMRVLLDDMAKLPLQHGGRITRDDGYD